MSAASSLASILGATSGASSTSTSTNGANSTTTAKGENVTQADFMQLLVAQLQNQDPLNPLDSADFAAQLAQFSSLQQLTEINSSLKNASGTGGSSSLDAVNYLGKQVLGTSSSVDVQSGTPTTLGYTLSGTADVHAHIVDGSGKTVAADIDLGSQNAGSFTLDLSKIPNVPHLADGAYTVTLAQVDAAGKASAVGTIGGGIVTGVDLTGTSPTLILGSRRIALTDVKQVQEPTTTGS
ncbi:MAG TPA: flagellar hook capping FlgD N-terminal domain-containing protein [Candidatus Binatia bacterium]